MRALRNCQTTLDFNPIHEHTERSVQLLDEVLGELGLKTLRLVETDLIYRLKNAATGATGMSADQVLRMALIKQMHGLSYRQLRERVEDSILLRRFAGYEFTLVPAHSTLQENIRRIEPETWEAINTALLQVARKRDLDAGEKVRIDTTAVETNIHHPTDAWLLWDGVRVLTRLLKQTRANFPGARFPFHDRTRAGKKLHVRLAGAGKKDRREDYRRLLDYAGEVWGYARSAANSLRKLPVDEVEKLGKGTLAAELERYAELLKKVIGQTRRRVLKGEAVPAEEKVVSLFEEHTDIIEKGQRETEFGHKICLTIGTGALIHDCLILDGNPADVEIFEESLTSYREKYAQIPGTVATDKGFGSGENAKLARKLGVEELTFSRRQLAPEAQKLLASGKAEKLLMRFRAGAEGIISAAKRGVNLARCTWRGWERFCSYVWSAIVAHNLKMMVAALA